MTRLILFMAAFLIASPAWADYYIWEDPKTHLTVSFPDTWEQQTNRNPTDILTVVAPSKNADPVCKIKAEEDSRYTIFPPQYGKAVQKDAVSIPFWQSYMGHYDEYDIGRVYDGGGLGRWIASYANFSYSTRDGLAMQSRRGIAFASLYYNTLYIVECSSLAHAYEAWDKNFRSVIKSIDFKKIYNEHKMGHYIDFLENTNRYFWAPSGPEGTIGYN
ncbi:MAG: hypothetical protein AAGB32_02235 [Pseudomonadota bacterium]